MTTISGADVFSPDGSHFRVVGNGTVLLASTRQLTSYDNSGPTCVVETDGTLTPGSCREVYRYHPGDPAVTCVSCDSVGAAPQGSAVIAFVDPAASVTERVSTGELTRNVSADGNRVFFQTTDKLVAADVNGDQSCPTGGYESPKRSCIDAYEWEANGTGSCHSSADNGGCVYLLSTGTSSDPSYFVDASTSGNDVFIRTTDRLVPQDKDNLYDLYDVRVDGGLASQHLASPPPCDSNAGACEGPGSATPPVTGAGSGSFKGPNNPLVTRCAPGKVRRHGRCVSRHNHKKKRHHKRSHRRANSNPGGSK